MPHELTFHERRRSLASLINGTMTKIDNEHRGTYDPIKRDSVEKTETALGRFYDRVFYAADEHKWFWESVAVSIDNPRHMSYSWDFGCPLDDNQKRKRSSVGKMLKTASSKGLCNFSVEEIDRIAHAIGMYFPDTLEYTFRVVTGTDVCIAYRDGLSTWGSCMRDHWDTYVKWYAENPEKVACVRIERGEEYCGRALLWTLDNGAKYLDKCYPSDGSGAFQALVTHAEENGWLRAGGLPGNAQVTMRPSRSEEYPYVDTFRYTSDDPEGCDNLTMNASGGDYSFDSTGGGYSGERDEYSCDACGTGLSEDDTYTPETGDATLCEHCYSRAYVYLSYRNPMTGDRVEGEYSREDCTECSECGQMRADDDVDEVEHRNVCCCCWEDCVTHCEECEGALLRDNAIEYDCNLYCSECHAEVSACTEGVDCECRMCTKVPEGQMVLPLLQQEDTNATITSNPGGQTDGARSEETAEVADQFGGWGDTEQGRRYRDWHAQYSDIRYPSLFIAGRVERVLAPV
jgi:hypothetical protein